MEITGKIISILPMQSGQGKNGEWKKQEVIIETQDQYPKKVCLTALNKAADKLFTIGETSTFHVNPESREFNGRWYTSLNIWKIEMKTLLIILCLIPAIGFSQLKPQHSTYAIRPLIEKKTEQNKRVARVVAANLILFTVCEYAIKTNNQQLVNASAVSFFAINTIGATYVLSINTQTLPYNKNIFKKSGLRYYKQRK